jgi:hypothetical protein
MIIDWANEFLPYNFGKMGIAFEYDKNGLKTLDKNIAWRKGIRCQP